MPTYEYLCSACKHKFEEFQSITAKAIRKCPKCKKNKVDRLLGTGAGMIFKGSGFYITDYRSEGYKSAAKADSGGGSGSSSDSSSGGGAGGGASAPSTPAVTPPAAAPKAESKSPKGGKKGS